MRIHPIIWFGALLLSVVALWALISDEDQSEHLAGNWRTNSGSDDESKLSDRDNAAEEVRAVATRITNIEQAIENQAQLNQTEREHLRSLVESNADRFTLSEANALQKRITENFERSLDELRLRMTALEDPQQSDLDETVNSTIGETDLHWISSSELAASISPYDTLPTRTEAVAQVFATEQTLQNRSNSRPKQSHLTIAATTTLLNATALTALVGRIPVRGQLQDPWRFKVIVEADNLAANGHRMPKLAGMLLAGTARGDLSLSCVSGNIDTATFIFTDGTIQTAQHATSPESNLAGLGWISDEYGNPCIAGELKTNALSYLTQATLVNTAKATAEAIANAQTESTTRIGSGEQTTSVVGDIDRFVAGYATKESLTGVADWLNDRQLNSFDAIYVPAGHNVAIHIEQAIHIDKDPAARKVQNLLLEPHNAAARHGWTD